MVKYIHLTMPDYSKGKIYKLVNTENDTVYIGSTCKKYLSTRMCSHRDAVTRFPGCGLLYPAMKEIGVDKFSIVLIHNFPCSSKVELETEEFKVIKLYLDNGKTLYNKSVELGIASICKETGVANGSFKRGSVFLQKSRNSWGFVWRENGKSRIRSFSVKTYGNRGALFMARVAQFVVFPPHIYGGDRPQL